MARLIPEKLHVKYLPGASIDTPVTPRYYMLTHSDSTGDLFLSIGQCYDTKQISGLYTRLMRDEVLAELKTDSEEPSLSVHCHVSGGFIFGRAKWRYRIFCSELSLVLEAIRFGDKATVKKRIYYVILGFATLFMWAGLLVGPALAIIASLVPGRVKKDKS
jgi:hypothetical protein